MNRTNYHYCAVPKCKNTSTRTPKKLFICVPKEPDRRRKWFELAKKNPKGLSAKTIFFFCEDHFDIPNDMANYMQYKLQGIRRIRMKKNCLPTKFECQVNRNKTTKAEDHSFYCSCYDDKAIKKEDPIEGIEIIKNEPHVSTSELCLDDKSILHDLLNKYNNSDNEDTNGIVKNEANNKPNPNNILIKCENNSDNENPNEFPIDTVEEENEPTVSKSNKPKNNHLNVQNTSSVFNIYVEECVEDEPTQAIIFNCKFCSETFSQETDLKDHQIIHSRNFQYICKDCHVRFSNSTILINHLTKKFHKNTACLTTSKHYPQLVTNKETFNCTECSQTFNHIHVDITSKGLFCKLCSITFTKNHSFKEHLIAHLTGKDLICKICSSSFVRPSYLTRHMKIHTNPEQQHTEIEAIEEGTFNCTKCLETFNQFSLLKQHIHDVHAASRMELYCETCSIVFTKIHIFEGHLRDHKNGRDLTCKLCKKSFVRSSVLIRHLKIHENPKPFSCEICGKRRARECDLKNISYDKKKCLLTPGRPSQNGEKHMEVHVEGHTKLTIICHICGKVLTRLEYLKNHEKLHTDGRLHLCQECSKGFVAKHLLLEHGKIHTGEKPFICEICEKSFQSFIYLKKKHENTHRGLLKTS